MLYKVTNHNIFNSISDMKLQTQFPNIFLQNVLCDKVLDKIKFGLNATSKLQVWRSNILRQKN